MNDNDQETDSLIYSVLFEDGEDKIEYKWGALNGLEKVYVNNSLKGSQKNYTSKTSSIDFSINETDYSVNMEVKSLVKGPVIITLFKNGSAIQRKRALFLVPVPKKEKPGFYLKFSTIIYSVLLILIANLGFNIPLIILITLFLIILLSIYLYKNKNYKMISEPVIEEDAL